MWLTSWSSWSCLVGVLRMTKIELNCFESWTLNLLSLFRKVVCVSTNAMSAWWTASVLSLSTLKKKKQLLRHSFDWRQENVSYLVHELIKLPKMFKRLIIPSLLALTRKAKNCPWAWMCMNVHCPWMKEWINKSVIELIHEWAAFNIRWCLSYYWMEW